MISDKSLHISTLKNVMCDILQAKMFSVIFCKQKKMVCTVECRNSQVSRFYLFPLPQIESNDSPELDFQQLGSDL